MPRRAAGRWLLGGALLLMLVCWPATVAQAILTSTAFDAPGSYTFSVPAGVSLVTVVAVGAPGGSCPQASTIGGWGAAVTGEIPVTRGEQFHVVVGGPGGNCGSPDGGAGGANGGGAGGRGAPPGSLGGAGGGGGTLVQESSPEATPLIIASGGGGAAAGANPNPPHDRANGGDPGQPGGDLGGSPGTQRAGGLSSGVTVHNDAEHGFNGAQGVGGTGGGGTECNVTAPTTGAGDGGGGGGGGYFGGGGGAFCQTPGGGGSGSTYTANKLSILTLLGPVTSMVPAGVLFLYSAPAVEESTGAVRFGTESTDHASAARTLRVTNLSSKRLIVSGVRLKGRDPRGFLVSDGCRRPLARGASCRVTVRFDPRFAGTCSAILQLLTNAGSRVLAVDLSGRGTHRVSRRLTWGDQGGGT